MVEFLNNLRCPQCGKYRVVDANIDFKTGLNRYKCLTCDFVFTEALLIWRKNHSADKGQ